MQCTAERRAFRYDVARDLFEELVSVHIRHPHRPFATTPTF